jgi:hypothetical protein
VNNVITLYILLVLVAFVIEQSLPWLLGVFCVLSTSIHPGILPREIQFAFSELLYGMTVCSVGNIAKEFTAA